MKNDDLAFNCVALLLTIVLSLMIAQPAFSDNADDVDAAIDALHRSLAALDTELLILEEELLYPASSRVAVYLSMDVGEMFALDSVTVKLNGKEVSHHLYTDRERNALYDGGVQKLYVGNAKQGANEITAVFRGIGPHDRDYKRAATVNFEHAFEPVFVDLAIVDDTGSLQPEFIATAY